ncbi:MAG: metallophosphoesterase [Gemmatimonadota bacterium]
MDWLTRRRFLQLAAATVAGGAATVGYTWWVEPEWLEITRVRMPVKRLPTALQGKTLVQLSDIHVGPNVSEEYVRESFRRVQALAPDIVVYTGDLTSSHRDLYTRAASAYATMPRGALGTVGVLGNHDYGLNWGEPAVARALGNIVGEAGMQVVTNDVAVVAGLQIVGLGDLWANQFDPRLGFSRCDPREPAIVLSHNPDSVDLTGWGSYDGWILSGHTHGGQCKPPFLPPPIIPVRNKRYTAGEFALDRGRRMYISRGVGTVLPVRFNVRPEVTVFELVAE